jgi:hypothetical protein
VGIFSLGDDGGGLCQETDVRAEIYHLIKKPHKNKDF